MMGLEALTQMEYPGRVIIVGKNLFRENIIIYGLSGRSTSSQARRLKPSDDRNSVFIEVTDQEQLSKGDPALLVYDAVIHDRESGLVVVSNGVQTNLIADTISSYRKTTGANMPLQNILPTAFAESHQMRTKDGREIDITSFEPDEPNFTPRISAVVQEKRDNAMLSINKRGKDGKLVRCFYDVNLEKGKGYMIATYNGENVAKGVPIPSFVGEPREVELVELYPDTVSYVYEALGQFRVGVALMAPYERDVVSRIWVKNLHGDR